jgi:hypothetical protein
MGTIFRRGTRTTPRFYFQYRAGLTADRRRRYTTHAAKGEHFVELNHVLDELRRPLREGRQIVNLPLRLGAARARADCREHDHTKGQLPHAVQVVRTDSCVSLPRPIFCA